MKKALVLLALLLLAGCTNKIDTLPTIPDTAYTEFDQDLVGSWTKKGDFTEDADYVETLTLNPDNTMTVHLTFREEPYQTLIGTWHIESDHLIFDIQSEEPYTLDYTYQTDLRSLTLTNETGTYTYYSE